MHGAGSGPWIFEPWRRSFEGWRIELADLQAGLDVAEASMADYARVVERATTRAPRPLVLCGWSLGGLVVLMAAEGRAIAALYGSETLEFPELAHWGLVLERRIPETLAFTIARLSA